MRWIVGDVHGCVRELEDLLREIRFRPGRDELWGTGDLVNRGPDSLAVLRLWREIGADSVLGNHDLHVVRAAAGVVSRRSDDTLDELLGAPDAPELLRWLGARPVLVVWPRIVLVHAALHPAWTDLPAQAAAFASRPGGVARAADSEALFALLARCCLPDGARVKHTGPPADCPDGSLPWDHHHRGDRLVVFGHWAQRGVDRTERVLCLDSGCAYGGALSAWNPDEDLLVQVPSRSPRSLPPAPDA
ncbi:MAG: metallophosphoesterase [Gemmatimonadetes bacterium]|nr:metallophosphoesterase [Gemmatimonadota bacterium]